MDITKLSDDELEALIQLYDSKKGVLLRKKELEKKIIETLDKIKNIEKELLILKNEYQEGGENKKIISIDEVQKKHDILENIKPERKQKKDLIDICSVLLKEYGDILNEIEEIDKEIDKASTMEEIETLSTNQGMKVETLNTVVHIQPTDLNDIILVFNSIENSIISETTINIVNEIIEKFKSNEEKVVENDNPYEMLKKLYNSNNMKKEENEEFLSRIPKFIEKDDTKEEKIIGEEENVNELKDNVSKIDTKENQIEVINANDNEDTINKGENSEDLNDENQNIVNINTDVEEINNNSEELTEDDSKVNLQVDSNIEQNVSTIDENLEQSVKEPINLNVLNENVVSNLNTEQAPEENKIVGMPNLDLPTENLTPVQNIEPPISEIKVPTFEVPAPNIPVSTKSEVNINNNVPLNEDEVNSILAGNDIVEPSSKEDVSEVIINEPSEPTKIANSTEAKVQTILGVWSKHKVPKTVIKNDIKKNENVVPLNAILSGSDNSQNTTTNNIQSFFSNAA